MSLVNAKKGNAKLTEFKDELDQGESNACRCEAANFALGTQYFQFIRPSRGLDRVPGNDSTSIEEDGHVCPSHVV